MPCGALNGGECYYSLELKRGLANLENGVTPPPDEWCEHVTRLSPQDLIDYGVYFTAVLFFQLSE